MQNKIRFKAILRGGPFDGAALTVDGVTEDESWRTNMKTFTFEGHRYTITDYDKETNQAEIRW